MSKMNPYEMFLKQVDEAVPYLNVEQEFIDILTTTTRWARTRVG